MSSKHRVLVVDDEPAIRALVARIVERAGLVADTARDGAEAIEMIASHSYAVMVLDLMMPNVDGYGLIEHLRQQSGSRPAVIVVSAGDAAALRQLDGSIVHSVVRKPFDVDVLTDLITAAAQSAGRESESGEGDILPFRR